MAQISVTLTVRKRWWYGIAYMAGLIASILRLLTEEQGERYIAWMVRHGMVVEADGHHLKP